MSEEQLNEINADRKARIELASAAVGVLRKHETIERWREVGDGALALQEEAMAWAATNQPKGKRYNHAWSILAEHWPELAAIDKATRSHAMWLAGQWTAIAEWLHTLPDRERLRINHPTAIRRRYDAAMHPKEPSSRRADAAEAADAAHDDMQAEIERLKEELARAFREIERLRTELTENGPLFDFKRDTAKTISNVLTSNLSQHKFGELLYQLQQKRKAQVDAVTAAPSRRQPRGKAA